MTTFTITGTATDSAGVVSSFSVTGTIDIFNIAGAVVPSVAPPNTLRTLTVTPTGGIGAITFGLPVSPGVTFTPVAGQSNQWTFTA